jgi:hypothetical protein
MHAPTARFFPVLGVALARCASIVCMVCMTCIAPMAHAQSAGRAVVIVVEGGAGDGVASLIATHVDAPHVVRDPHSFLAALGARGTHLLAPGIDNRAINAILVKRAHAAADETHVDVAILVAHRKAHHNVRGHLWIIDAHSEGALVDEDLASTNSNDEATEVWTAAANLFPAVTKAASKATTATPSPAPAPSPSPPSPSHAAPAAENAEPSVDRVQTAAPEGASQTLTRDNALVILQANVAAASRHVSYVDRLTASLRPYDLPAAPLASIAVEAYPLTRLTLPSVIGGLGVTGDYARAFAFSSKDVATGTTVGERWQSYDFGLRERVDIERAFVLGIDVGYGAIDFTFDKPAFAAQLPSVGYRFIRAAADLRRALGDFAVYGGGGYLFVLSSGDMGGLFPRETVGGIEARIGASYALARSFELSLGIGYTRFFYSMHPLPGDANVAGGALDEMVRVSLGLAYLL